MAPGAAVRCGVLLVACLSVSRPVPAAELTRANSDTLQGTVQGLVVVKGTMTMRHWVLLGGTTEWPVVYYVVVNGRDILTIDGAGVRTSRDSPRVVLAGEFFEELLVKGTAPPEDLDALTRLIDRWQPSDVWQLERGRLALRRKSGSAQIRVPLARGPAMFSVYLPDDLTEEQWKRSVPEMARPAHRKKADLVQVAEELLGELRIEDSGRVLRRFLDVETADGVVTVPLSALVEFKVKVEPTPK